MVGDVDCSNNENGRARGHVALCVCVCVVVVVAFFLFSFSFFFFFIHLFLLQFVSYIVMPEYFNQSLYVHTRIIIPLFNFCGWFQWIVSVTDTHHIFFRAHMTLWHVYFSFLLQQSVSVGNEHCPTRVPSHRSKGPAFSKQVLTNRWKRLEQ